jgi:RNA polymerase sigma factor FliA
MSAPRRGSVSDEQERLVRDGLPILELVARRIERRLRGRIRLDDLQAIGRAALVDIARTYDPNRSRFATYCALKLKWAIYDGVRRETHGRTAAVRARALRASELYGHGAASVPIPAEDGMPPSMEAYQDRLSTLLAGHAAALAVGLVTARADIERAPDFTGNPEELAAEAEFSREVKRLIGKLPERERALVERHYYGGERFDEIAKDLGISKSWASRLHAQALDRLSRSIGTLVP